VDLGEQRVHDPYVIAALDERVDEMTPNESRPSRH
jgi:hypothetical protein